MDFIFPFIFFVTGFAVVFLRLNSNKKTPEEDKSLKDPEVTSGFLMGQYVEGLPGQIKPSPLVYCSIAEDDFVLRRGINGEELGRIPRNSLEAVYMLSKEADVITTWPMKKHKVYCLEINWSDTTTSKQKTIFRFAIKKRSEDVAFEAAQILYKWRKTT